MNKSGSFCVLLSAIFFSCGGLFYKITPWNSLAICSARSFIALIVIFVYLLIIKHKFVFNKYVVLAALANACTAILYSLANKMTTAGNTIVLQFTMPVYVIIITSLIYKIKPTKLELRTCLFVLIGIIIFFIDSLSAGNMIGNILALVSGVTYALYFIFNKNENSDPFTAILISLVLTSFIGLPQLLKTDIAGSSPNALLAVLGLGLIQQAGGHLMLAYGLKNTPTVTASLLSGLEPILNPILVAIFYNELLTPLSLIGAIIVLVTIISYNVIVSKKEIV